MAELYERNESKNVDGSGRDQFEVPAQLSVPVDNLTAHLPNAKSEVLPLEAVRSVTGKFA
jgi:hypothetical protein